jgi:formylmethanofuran dehydrogenase subunit E
LEKTSAQLQDYVEELDEDLGDVEEYLFTEEGDVDVDEDDDLFDDEDDEDDEDEIEESDSDIYELECPSCGETIYLDESLLDETDILCPACHESITFDIEMDDEEIEDIDTITSVGEHDKPAFNYESSD